MEAAEVNGSQRGSGGSHSQASISVSSTSLASVTSQLPPDLDLGAVLAVSRALVDGLTQTQIIEEILKFKGRKFEEGKRKFKTIQAIIEEYS